MKKNTKRRACLWIACLVVATAAGAAAPFRDAPVPGWVAPVPALPGAATRDAPVEEGAADYLLVDHQLRLGDVVEHYERYVQRLVSHDDVDEAAQISVEIDPERERILLHAVRVTRDGEVIDKLPTARRSMLNREQNLKDGLIDGRVTLHLLLQDLRVGDVLDYSYTVERRDPPAERGFDEWFGTRWTVPVRAYRLRILRSASRPLWIQDRGELGTPVETRQGAWLETRWSGSDLPAVPDEESRPGWNFLYPRIEVSEFADWDAVRAWSLPMYAQRETQSPELQRLVEKLRGEPDEATRIVAALRFVQDDIRYTGLEIGMGAWRPSQPDVVLARRFGDCKDKALLLTTLLNRLGIEAHPALVHSSVRRGIADRLPSPGAFDHVIVRATLAGRDYWLDATQSGQGGDLRHLVQADFGKALVIAADARGLADIPARDAPTPVTQVTETYDLRAGTRKRAKFAVQTTYHDAAADDMRVKMRGTTAAQLGREYAEYYRNSFPKLRQSAPLTYTDDRANNVFVTRESYEIDSPFEKDPDGSLKLYTEAYLITDRTSKPKQVLRTTPLAREFPLHVRHEIVALLPGEWSIDDATKTVSNDWFRYSSRTHYDAGKLELSYELSNLRDHVPVDELDAFLAALDEVHDDAYFALTYGGDARPRTSVMLQAIPAPPDLDSPAGVLALVLCMGLGAGAGTAILLWRYSPVPRPALPHARAGLGGWMKLPVIQACMGPLVVGSVAFAWFSGYADAASYEALSPGGRGIVFASVLVQGFMLVASVVQIVLLFLRRSSFPLAFVLTKSGYVVLALLAVFMVTGGEVVDQLPARIAQLVGTVISSAIWIAYVLRSQRVRATFVRDAHGRYPATA